METINRFIKEKRVLSLSKATDRPFVRELQSLLDSRGYEVGPVDGIVGPRTLAAWAKFKKDRFLSDPDLVGVSSLQLLLNAPERSGYFLPTDGIGWVSSPFGVRSMGFHRGVDIAANRGTPVHAIADGFVSIAVPNCRIGDFRCGGGYGNVVYVDHPNGIQTRYAHLTDVTVKNGQRVKRGEKLGTVGNTGHSYGDHLHFEYRVNGKAIDPLTKINPIV